MHIKLNGKVYETRAATLAELVAELNLSGAQVAIEQNREIVPRARHGQTALSAGDEIEVVQFIGGG
ncbi:MAG: sulfur carrier protein ThiS [Alphaproteobacteria bacterium]|nr:sulfur carrier protein ThiS [Alphaproteobacteria bacterium]